MKKHIFSLLIGICISIQLFAQESNSASTDPREDGVYLKVDQLPEFPGGMNAMMKFLVENIKYPIKAQENKITGKVIVQFVVEPDGKLDKIKILRSVDPLLDEEAIRVVNSMPLWNPGKHKGETVPVAFTIPINFNLTATSKLPAPKKILITGDTNIKKPQLEGFWQMYQQITPGEKEGTYEGFAAPFMKTLLRDKSFQNFILGAGTSKIIITAKGKYKQTSDNTYVEKIDSSITNPFMNKKDVKLTFEFLNSNLMKITFSVSDNQQLITEYWARITQPEMPSNKVVLLAD